MDTEQNAKAYEMALEAARKELGVDRKEWKVVQQVLCNIFPQLTESEDERIRKSIIRILQVGGYMSPEEKDKAFAYLEKQKENPKSSDSIPSDCTLDAKCEDRWHKVADSMPDNPREVLCKDEAGNYFIGRYYVGEGWEISNYDDEDKPHHLNPPVSKWIDFPLEKQKEQRHNIEICPHSIKSKSYSETGYYPIEDCDYGLELALLILEKTIGKVQGFQTDDGIREHQTAIEAVRKAKEQKQELPLMGGDTDTYFDDLRITTKPLTSREWFNEGIKYAQKLQKEQNPVPIKPDDKQMLERIMELVEFCDDKETIWNWLCEKVKVAAQKPAEWSEKHIADIFEKVGLAKIAREQGNDKLTNALQDAMLELSKAGNAKWNEVDEHYLNSVIRLVHGTNDGAWGSCIGDRIENWLKSLPERFNLQPKEEWSEEDKQDFDDLIMRFGKSLKSNRCYFTSYDVDWLKSKFNGNSCK